MNSQTNAAVYLANPTSRSGRNGALQDAVRDELLRRGVRLRVEETGSAAELRAAAAAAAAAGERVIAVGGDGTVHQATNAVAGTDAVLGIIAAGTGNDLATGVGLPVLSPDMRPAKAETAVSAAVTAALSAPVAFDAIAVSDVGTDDTLAGGGIEWCGSIATCGFSVDVDHRSQRMSRPRGPSKYTLATIAEARQLRIRRYGVSLDGEEREIDAALMAIANTVSFGGGFKIAPDAIANDGLLDVTVVGDVSRTTLLRLLPATRKGRHVKHPEVTLLRGRVVEIRPLPDKAAHDKTAHGKTAADDDAPEPTGDDLRGDGEPIGRLPLRLRIVPGALRIAGGVPPVA